MGDPEPSRPGLAAATGSMNIELEVMVRCNSTRPNLQRCDTLSDVASPPLVPTGRR
ncbi:MAG TPA: hypothetical protein PLS53_02215 [Thermoanaerobaculaceae bacterium]|nr:hypothetical protein [Thermoanaerobaculaceae bacterium]HPS76951.1 hypothetical protein [Thermoanaerobaculaceae bacterium]